MRFILLLLFDLELNILEMVLLVEVVVARNDKSTWNYVKVFIGRWIAKVSNTSSDVFSLVLDIENSTVADAGGKDQEFSIEGGVSNTGYELKNFTASDGSGTFEPQPDLILWRQLY